MTQCRSSIPILTTIEQYDGVWVHRFARHHHRRRSFATNTPQRCVGPLRLRPVRLDAVRQDRAQTPPSTLMKRTCGQNGDQLPSTWGPSRDQVGWGVHVSQTQVLLAPLHFRAMLKPIQRASQVLIVMPAAFTVLHVRQRHLDLVAIERIGIPSSNAQVVGSQRQGWRVTAWGLRGRGTRGG